jgi:hypothetical protein
LTLVLVLMPSIPAAAQTRPEQDSRIFRTEPMGNGYARTGVNTAIYNVFVEGANRRIQFLGGRWTDPNRHHATLATQAGSVPRSVARHPFAPS